MTRRLPDGGPFKAWAACPRCDAYACHRVKPPRPYDGTPVDEPSRPERDDETTIIESFGGSLYRVQRRDYTPPAPAGRPEYEYAVIRQCLTCATEWGNQ